MTKQRPASLDGSLLVKKGQAKPSVAPTTDPVTKKVSRFPDPETISELPLTSTPPIGELYGNKEPETAPPQMAPAARAPEVTPSENEAEVTTPITAPVASHDDRAVPETREEEQNTPEPRVVFLLPRPPLRVILSLLLVTLMGLSAWYLMGTSDNTGTQRLASVGPSEEAPTSDGAASAISPPPSGAVSTKTPPQATPNSQTPAATADKTAPVPSAKPALVKKVSSTSAAGGTQYAIQLLATKSTEQGQAAWNQISAKHGAQLSDLGLDMQTVTLQGRGKFVRVRAGPIGEKQVAVNRCKELSAAGQDCLVVKF